MHLDPVGADKEHPTGLRIRQDGAAGAVRAEAHETLRVEDGPIGCVDASGRAHDVGIEPRDQSIYLIDMTGAPGVDGYGVGLEPPYADCCSRKAPMPYR